MRQCVLGESDPEMYATLTPEERQAWLHPLHDSYHAFYLERMGADTFRFRDSREGCFYIGTHFEVCQHIWTRLSCRTFDPRYTERQPRPLTILTQEEVDDLLSDL